MLLKVIHNFTLLIFLGQNIAKKLLEEHPIIDYSAITISIDELSRGATAIKARGLYRNIDREILTTVVTLKELSKLLSIIKNIDLKAFITVSNVHEVMGEGFRKRI